MAALILKIGDSNPLKFLVKDSAGSVEDLTDGTLKVKISKSIDDTDAEAEYFGEYTSFTDPTNGIHREVIPPATSATWSKGDYLIQSRFIDSTGVVTSEDVGRCVIVKNLIDNE